MPPMRVHKPRPSEAPASHRASRRLRAVGLLPSVVTLLNLSSGFAAIYCCLLSIERAQGTFRGLTYLTLAGYLVLLAMVFDALDGRLARLTRRTSDFGGQLDSLADVVSFGVAPAMMVIGLMMPVVHAEGALGGSAWLARLLGRATGVACAIFACCAAIRLARFNVENVHDESAHLSFRGLPTPGAAAALVSLVLLHEEFVRNESAYVGWLVWLLPPAALLIGLAMVSRLRYVHVFNMFFKGRRPIRYLVGTVILLAALWILQEIAIAVVACGYALSGPGHYLATALAGRHRRHAPPSP